MYSLLPRTLPAGLGILAELALDARWTWSHAGDRLWQMLGADLWERTRSPWVVLQHVPQKRLDALASDPAFASELARVAEERTRYLEARTWYESAHERGRLAGVAYFSMEFGLSEAFPLYAGGLGILAGDYLKTASDLGVPVTGIGLLYQEGYFRQVLDADGRQREMYPYNDPVDLPIRPVIDADGDWLRIELALPGRTLTVRAWQANIGRVRLYLLDSNDPLNTPADRGITAELYGHGAELRLLQEIVLGIGGWALLERIGLAPDICHMNEGHAAFAALERIRALMRKTGLRFEEARWAARAGNVFTTHTPVPAGFDVFAPALVEKYFASYTADVAISPEKLLALGRADPARRDEAFNMTYLAIRSASRTNGVSRLHGAVSRHLFRNLYPRWPVAEVPVGHVTNGVHVPSWDSAWSDALWTEASGKNRWQGGIEGLSEAIHAVGDEALLALRARQRSDLVRYARERLAWQLSARGAPAEEIAKTSRVLDPDILTLGFARRFTGYKRPNLLLRNPDHLARLLLDARRPLQIVVAGKAHPADDEGKRFIEDWVAFARREDVRERAVFLEDYDMALAQEMVQGVDVWVNTPRSPWEACGTSGMKVLVNGGLNVSTFDGWWAEAASDDVGWTIGGKSGTQDDDADAAELYRTIERQVVPLFYERGASGVPAGWIERVRRSIATLTPLFSSNRMLKSYVEETYLPAAGLYRRRIENGGRLAVALHEWFARLASRWDAIRFGPLEVARDDGSVTFGVAISLGDIPPEWITVELYAEAEGRAPQERHAMQRSGNLHDSSNSFDYRCTIATNRHTLDYTPRVLAHHPDAIVPVEASLIAWER